jgi:hypothetical protein
VRLVTRRERRLSGGKTVGPPPVVRAIEVQELRARVGCRLISVVTRPPQQMNVRSPTVMVNRLMGRHAIRRELRRLTAIAMPTAQLSIGPSPLPPTCRMRHG